MITVANKPFMLGVVMLNVIMLNVIMLNVVMLNVVMLSVVAHPNIKVIIRKTFHDRLTIILTVRVFYLQKLTR